MPRSRSRKERGARAGRPVRSSDSLVLLELLDLLEDGSARATESDLLLIEAFDRAAWSFHGGPGPSYAGPDSLARDRALLRAREWFLFEFELPAGLTAAEEWFAERAGEPGSAADRRAVTRFVNSECGVFEVEEARSDGWLRLAPLPQGERVLARPIERGVEMLPGFHDDLPSFEAGDTIGGRVYWRDDGRAELSAGADRIDAEVKARLLADAPPAEELHSTLAIEALFGADASTLLSRAGDSCYPLLVDELLWALSDGLFGYRDLWRELEGQADPVAITRQLLAELAAWTDIEPELLVWAVAGAWLRRRGAAADETAATAARERRAVEDHVRTVLDVPADPGWPTAAAGSRVSLDADEAVALGALDADEIEWIVDIRPGDWYGARDATVSSSSPYPLACAIVEQRIAPFDDLEAGEGRDQDGPDEEDDSDDVSRYDPEDEEEIEVHLDEAVPGDDVAEDESDEAEAADDEDLPWLVRSVVILAGEDEAEVALDALVETMLAEGNETRPRRIAFRQRRLAARIGEALREAGFEIALRYFSDAADVATLEGAADEEEREADARQAGSGAEDGAHFVASDEERRAYTRLLGAAHRSRDAMLSLASLVQDSGGARLTVTLAQPLAFEFTTLEGVEDRVASLLVVPDASEGDLAVGIHFAPPGAGGVFDCRGASGALLLATGDMVVIEIAAPGDEEERVPAQLDAAGLPRPAADGPWVVPIRYRYGAPPAFLRGRDLEVGAAVMEALAALVDQRAVDLGGEESIAVEVRVEPLGDVTVEWIPGD